METWWSRQTRSILWLLMSWFSLWPYYWQWTTRNVSRHGQNPDRIITADALVLKHQTVSIHDSDPITFVHVLRHFTRNGFSLGEYMLDLKFNQIKNYPVVRGLNRMMMITQSRFTSQYHKAIQSHTSELLLWYEVYQYDQTQFHTRRPWRHGTPNGAIDY